MRICQNNCEYKDNCGIISAILGVISGIIVSVLFSFGLLPVITTALWISLGLSGLVLLYILALSLFNFNSISRCLSKSISLLLTGSIGTILSVLAISAIVLDITSVISIVLVGITAFFLIFLVSSVACVISRCSGIYISE